MAKKVIVYSTSTCPWCARVKQYLKENNIEFQNLDVSGDQLAADEMMSKTGQMGGSGIRY
ncbi:MAG: glutaredoxin domain-containing protein [Candidatus Omnitrophota bacterium]